MTTRPTDPTKPLAELDANIFTTGAGSAGMPEDDEAQWQRWCAEAGVPGAYIPPGKAESNKVAQKAKGAKKTRLSTMRKAISRAKAAAGTAEPARADARSAEPARSAAAAAAADSAAAAEATAAPSAGAAPAQCRPCLSRVDDADEADDAELPREIEMRIWRVLWRSEAAEKIQRAVRVAIVRQWGMPGLLDEIMSAHAQDRMYWYLVRYVRAMQREYPSELYMHMPAPAVYDMEEVD